ncbi:LLM class flavin-dependent oxidoreductase [Kineosporia rhizophila]|uniref:LLM class flavin-dependent oxidoreductase n=1 Tax=Kineosporia TaxID=49184 RepID=UPI001E5ED338|nr:MULTISPECIES: LLM class flavin-dependent oxidoreductase [Kineosporia]MCE0535248.1 LLM class flavin-dependent oxidoreductase [Kineosporia rhizophila]GLY16970.1 putative monooxygenase [Kineosporia sp. NBRC 101677]
MSTPRMRLNGLRQNTVGHTAMGLWRHPDSRAHEYRTIRHWVETAQILERGGFDSLFIADVLGPLEVYQGKVDAALRDGAQTPSGDPLLLIPAMAAATRRIGFAVTVSTTYAQPYALARTMTSLDHLTDGRIGWNVVTSALDSAARNLGLDQQIPHDERYLIADEFMDVAYKLWEGSWEDGAVVHDVEAGVFADPAKVHAVGHEGRYFRVPGIALAEPSVQRTPVIFQAGSSPAGSSFAGKHAEGVFLSTYKAEMARDLARRFRAEAAAQGRDPQSLKIFAIATVVTGATDEDARERLAGLQRYASLEGSLARWSALLHIDLSVLDPDVPLEHSETEGIRGLVDVFTRMDPDRTWTPRSLAEFVGVGGGGPLFVGSPGSVADQMEAWMETAGIDGFNLADPIPPAGHREFVDLVVPELRRRGRVWDEYEGDTLREYFRGKGLARVADDHPAAAYRR